MDASGPSISETDLNFDLNHIDWLDLFDTGDVPSLEDFGIYLDGAENVESTPSQQIEELRGMVGNSDSQLQYLADRVRKLEKSLVYLFKWAKDFRDSIDKAIKLNKK
ncbi:uncharacterized protein TRUGW13939_08784 [Talaromyces rugulosus]|uniref:Uncharacterized protein n=1 Tax=Talaromyces rugulosus TaxID=121627 RepID=A0A7H8R5J4_TALRU|nr:uncharacterized protein TRUGW13939_08784 [Talaromyces rugulosus]QKX61632.1 hypothetical protein TRUGW13939_08784 [Talaromyces rugulosus]